TVHCGTVQSQAKPSLAKSPPSLTEEIEKRAFALKKNAASVESTELQKHQRGLLTEGNAQLNLPSSQAARDRPQNVST
uniref:Uncharacterized protein n=1 Tax=Anopheles atroparvus TaxID=41427 RepID=A0AAG5D0S3_ANOAO